MKKEINCCTRCKEPVVFTFAFRGAEFYCLLCGNKTGMLGGSKSIKSTPLLRSKKKIVEKLWDILGKNFLGSGGFTLDNCKKCQTRKNEYHTDHLTGLEKEKDIFVRNIINKLANED